MPNLRVTIPTEMRQTPDTGSAPAGLKLTITRMRDGVVLSPPVELRAVWDIQIPGNDEQFSLVIQSVRADGTVIAAIPLIEFRTPPLAQTTVSYMHPLTGVTLEWV